MPLPTGKRTNHTTSCRYNASVLRVALMQQAWRRAETTLSWARPGARVSGLDFSPNAIEIARNLAADCRIDAEFWCADVYDAVHTLGGSTYDRNGAHLKTIPLDAGRIFSDAAAYADPDSWHENEHTPGLSALGQTAGRISMVARFHWSLVGAVSEMIMVWPAVLGELSFWTQ